MVFTPIALVLAIIAVILNFISISWGWLFFTGCAVCLFLYLKALQAKKWKRIPELSNEANKMFSKYGHFYIYQHGARDFSVACTVIQLSATIIAISNIFQKFWWGILFGIIAWVVMSFIAKGFNPTNFLTPDEEDAHQEVIQYIQKRIMRNAAKRIYGNEVPSHAKESIDKMR
jgi:hypothetical protein